MKPNAPDHPFCGGLNRGIDSLLSDAIFNSTSPCFVVDGQGDYLQVNKAYADLLGTTPERMRGTNKRDYLPPETVEAILADHHWVLTSGTPYSREVKIPVQGNVLTYISALFPVLDAEGLPSAVCGMAFDITHKKHEEQLHEAHRSLAILANGNHAVLHARSEQNLARDICHILCESGGFPAAWIVVSSMDTGEIEPMAHCGFSDDFLQQLHAVCLESASPSCPCQEAMDTLRIVRRQVGDDPDTDSAVTRVAREAGFRSFAAIPLSLGGELLGALHVFSHQAETFDEEETRLLDRLAENMAHGIRAMRMEKIRTRVLRALERSEARFRAVVQDQTETICRFNKYGQFTFTNEVFCRFFNKNPEDLMGRTWHSTCFHEDLERVERELSTLSPDNPVIFVENRVFNGYGEVIWMQFVNRGFFDADGELVEVQSVGRDIQKQKMLQAETMRSAQLASVGELAAGVAHEINNPINGIINCAQILSDEAALAGRPDKYQQMIIHESRRIARIVNSLLHLARDGNEPDEEVSLPDILEYSLDLLRTQMLKSGVRITVETPVSGNCPRIRARSGGMQQVFINLLNNAHHALNQRFPSPCKEKRLRIRFINRQENGRQWVCVYFKDNGAGISREHLERVFTPFFTTKRQGEGTGLGLTICRSIVEQFGGRISISGIPNEGAEVGVTLPAIVHTNSRTDFP